jgi:hypothetical protein
VENGATLTRAHPTLAADESETVQVFGRRHERSNPTIRPPASEKRHQQKCSNRAFLVRFFAESGRWRRPASARRTVEGRRPPPERRLGLIEVSASPEFGARADGWQ